MSGEHWPGGDGLAHAYAEQQQAQQQETSSSRAFVVITPEQLLESARIEWKRDWDAMFVGFVAGALSVLAVQGLW